MARPVFGSEQQENTPTTWPSCYLEFTERSYSTYLVINKPRSRLLMVEKVIRLSVIVPFFNVEGYAAENLTNERVALIVDQSGPLRR